MEKLSLEQALDLKINEFSQNPESNEIELKAIENIRNLLFNNEKYLLSLYECIQNLELKIHDLDNKNRMLRLQVYNLNSENMCIKMEKGQLERKISQLLDNEKTILPNGLTPEEQDANECWLAELEENGAFSGDE